MALDILEKAHQIRRSGRPFAIATVIRAEKPTSAKAGSTAIILADGSLEGWVGGSCAEPTIRREARQALRDGNPRLIRLCPPEKMGTQPREGVIEVALTCVSGGTLEIYIEPHLSQPHLVVAGHLATAQALTRLAKALGFRVSAIGLDAGPQRFPDADWTSERLDLSALEITPNTYIVVASHGNYDEDILQAALASEAAYVALVASRSRAKSILDYLAQAGSSQEERARLKYPAGLDLGAITPEEIALSILAEVVQVRRQQGSEDKTAGSADPGGEDQLEARDPVCGMMVEIPGAQFISEYNGQIYYFCAAGCKRSFDREPEKYL